MLPVKPAVKALIMFGTVSMVPMAIMTPARVVIPVCRRTPVPTSPHPMVVTPSPAPTHPNATRHRANRRGLYYRSRHGLLYHHRGRRRDSEVDTETNPGICSGDSQSSQGQNCDSLFHNLYPFDASPGQNIVTTALPFCKEADLVPTQ
jgi:hypothetical protein